MAFVLLVLTVSSAVISSALGKSPLLLDTLSSPSSQMDTYSYCDREFSCVDCSTVRLCAPTPDGQNLYEIQRFKCGSSYPYCNRTSGSCTSTLDPSCYTIVSTNFTCMRDGYFPDPYNCTTYYHCQNQVAYQYSCVYPNSYYHPGYQYCVSSSYYCTSSTASSYCQYSSYAGRKIAISYTNNYFLYCGWNRQVAAVDKCIGAYYFDATAQICLPDCPNAGLFPKDDDCANYYKCTPKSHELNSGFFMTDMTCPEGKGFSESEYDCVDRSLAPNCNHTSPDLFSK